MVALVTLATVGCAGNVTEDGSSESLDALGPDTGVNDPTEEGGLSSPPDSPASDTDPPSDATSAVDTGTGDPAKPPPLAKLACNGDPPAGAKAPPPLPTYAGACPTLASAPAANAITSSGASRSFKLAIPAGLDPKEKLPVIFLWHWLGGDAQGFYDKGEIQNAVDKQRFLAIIPESKKNASGKKVYQFQWPATLLDSEAAVAEETKFMDDMLACVAKQFPTVNANCISTGGVSAGALWTDQLAWRKSAMLSSFISMSGGINASFAKSWGPTARHVPGLVLWGGPTDSCGGLANFQSASQSLEGSMAGDGSFMIECVHNCGHAAPPVEPPPGFSVFSGIWNFAFDHPYWLGTGESPYKATGVPKSLPPWCAIGKGAATPRTGACPTASAC